MRHHPSHQGRSIEVAEEPATGEEECGDIQDSRGGSIIIPRQQSRQQQQLTAVEGTFRYIAAGRALCYQVSTLSQVWHWGPQCLV